MPNNITLSQQAMVEIERINNLLADFNIPEKRIMILQPVIENTAWMKVKLDEAREVVQESTIVISYDNGGGQKGIRENPIFKGYEALWKSYMSGMNAIINVLPQDAQKEETAKVVQARTTLELVREKHKKEA